MDLAVTTTGAGSPPVMFVHGVLDRGRSFSRVAALLEAECRMLWYDRRGYGDSLDAAGAPVTIDGHIDDLVGVLGLHGGEPAVVAGHSFGGVTVVGAALRAPELVRGVVLYETPFPWLPGWDDAPVQALLSGEDPEGAGVRRLFPRYDALSDDERARLQREARAFLAEERSVRTGRPPYDVAALAVPLVYGHGGDPRFTGVADQLERAVAGPFDTVVVPGAGHNAHRTSPDAFASLVRRGLSFAARH